jgi:hypothetical protein
VAAAAIHTAYKELATGNRRALLELIDEQFEWVEPDLPGYPLSGTHRGVAGVEEGVLAALEGLTWAVDEEIAVGDRVVITGTLSRWGLRFAHVWELDRGHPVRVTAYFDRSRLALAATRRELADTADDLLEQAAELRRQWSRLGDALRAAGPDTAVDEGGSAEGGEHGDDEPASASVRLVAVDLAQEGSTREEVEAYLVEELGVEDPDPILDEVFGVPVTAGSEQRAAALDVTRRSRLFARNRE